MLYSEGREVSEHRIDELVLCSPGRAVQNTRVQGPQFTVVLHTLKSSFYSIQPQIWPPVI